MGVEWHPIVVLKQFFQYKYKHNEKILIEQINHRFSRVEIT